jgi:hypothetical protein
MGIRGDKSETIHLVEVGKISEPICMIPDLAHKDKFRYFAVIRKKYWAQGFKEWLNQPHTRKFDEPQS